MSGRDRSRGKPKSDAAKRVGADAARSVSAKATKAVSTPPPSAKTPPAPPSASKSVPAAAKKSVPPAAAKKSAPPAAQKSVPVPAEAKAPAKGVGAKKAARGQAIAGAAARESRSGAQADASAGPYWSEPKAAVAPNDTTAKPTRRSRAPLADLRMSQPAASLETIAMQAGIALPSPADSVTVAPPSRRSRDAAAVGESVAPEPDNATDDEIWSDDPGQAALGGDRAESAAARLTRSSHQDPRRAAADFGSSQSLLSTDYYFRQYGAHGMRSLAADVDDFGFDPHVDAKLKPLLELVCQRYFRVELVGAEQLPPAGRALMVANRGGTLPWDGLVLRTALRSARPELSPVRWLAEDSVIHFPFMGVVMNRLGAVRACPENAERLLAQDRLVAVFPEGAHGSRKLFRDRYRLQRFGRGGYVKLALKLGVPILPTAIIGAEDTNPVLRRSRLLGRLVGSDTVPITPTFPWFGLAGLLPAPVRWRIAIGEPIDLSSYGPAAADDALVVHRLNEQIRSALQTLVDENKAARGSSLFGT
jgi:1-acyl-sn-glycerol-3-phosphate acyltransferase